MLPHRVTLFWLGWLGLTFAAAVWAAWTFRSPAVVRGTNPPGDRGAWSRGAVLWLTMLAVFLGAYSGMILAGEEFVASDESELINSTLRGVDSPPMILPVEGRFYPLSLQEFNLIRHVSATPAGYHAFAVAEVLALVLILLVLDRRLSLAGRVTVIGLALLTPSVAVSFTGLVFAERNIVLLLACLAISIKLFERSHSAWPAIAAVTSAQLMLYLKEPVFLLLLSFAGARLILRSRNASEPGWDFARLRDEESRLDWCLAAQSLAFVPFYAVMMFPHTSATYLAGEHTSLSGTLRFYLDQDLLVWVFVTVAAGRAYAIFRRRAEPELLLDGLASGGVAYFAAFAGLRMTRSYYLAPADFIAVLFLGHLLFSRWGRMRTRLRIAAGAVAAAVLCQNLWLSAVRVAERKYVVHGTAEMARAIRERYRQDPRLAQSLYFPFAEMWTLTDFLAYLRYSGLPVGQPGEGSTAEGDIQIYSGKATTDGRCWPYATFICHPGAAAASGSLMVVFPQDPLPPANQDLPLKPAGTLLPQGPAARIPAFLRRELNPPALYVGVRR